MQDGQAAVWALAVAVSLLGQLQIQFTDCVLAAVRRPCSLEDSSDRAREVRISCPDATGLGCDVARMMMDFALRILEGVQLVRPMQ